LVLLIIDGFGYREEQSNNAIAMAKTPCWDQLQKNNPVTLLDCAGDSVGLPDQQMGNSEVGHLHIGSGRLMRQELSKVSAAVKDGSFFSNEVLCKAVDEAINKDKALHIMGLLSPGGVHSHELQIAAMAELAVKRGLKKVYLHAFLDGRDVPPKSAMDSIELMESKFAELGAGQIISITGRFYAMDRDTRWNRTQRAFDAMVHGIGKEASDPLQALEDAYANDETDEFIFPRIMPNARKVESEDSLIFFNFRNDRPRQLSAALGMEDFKEFDRGEYTPLVVTCLTEYDKKLLAPVAFPPERPSTNLAHAISLSGYKQLHTSETEKYAHVTFFLNGGRETPYAGEDRIMIDSPRVHTYDEAPEMSAKELADVVINAVEEKEHSFIVVNFPNGDMVGHSAIPEAIIKAVETLDTEVSRVLDAAVENEYSVILTADHGNCDEYIDPFTGDPSTQHTVYPVPCLIVDKSFWRLRTGGGLSNIAPTVLQLMGLTKPEGITCKSLLMDEMTDEDAVSSESY
jgi:2,3-bisphosphoglycerate-independent phosphoglycerate mutase